jgi:methionyl-tRNA formyltransferase
MNKDKVILIGTSIMLEKCIEISIKNFKKIFVITKDKKIKNKFKTKVKFININQIEKINSDYLFSILNDTILSSRQLKTIKKNSFNFHDGPLPKYAGLFSSSWAVFNNEKKHGVCWHKIEDQTDAGDILIEKKFKINKNDTAYDVDVKGIITGISLYKDLIQKIKNKYPKFKKQNLTYRTYFGKSEIKKLLQKFLKSKTDKNLIKAFSLSSEKNKIIYRFFKINLKKLLIKFQKKENKTTFNELKSNKLIKIFNNVLKINFVKNKNYNLNNIFLNNHPKWDSMAHVKLLSDIEKKMKIKIDEKNIDQFSSLRLILNYFNKSTAE